MLWIDSTRKEFSRVSDAVRDCSTPDRHSSTSKDALTALHLSSTMESVLLTFGLASLPKPARITSANGARLLPATETTEPSAWHSKRTSLPRPWVATSELCFTPTSRSELRWTNSARSKVEARVSRRQTSSGKHDVDPFPKRKTSNTHEPSGSQLFNLDFSACNPLKPKTMSLLPLSKYLRLFQLSSRLVSVFSFNSPILFII